MCPLSVRVNSFFIGIVCWANCMSALFSSVLDYFSATHCKTPGSEARCSGSALSAALQCASHRAMVLGLY